MILGKASHASRLLYRTTDNDGSEEIWSVLSQNGVGGKWHSLRLWLVENGIHTENYYGVDSSDHVTCHMVHRQGAILPRHLALAGSKGYI